MSTIDTVKTAVKTVMGNVSGIDAAHVYKAQRLLSTDLVCKNILVASGSTVNAWFISCIGFSDDIKSIGTQGMNYRDYTVQVVGYYTIDDTTTPTSEENFEVLCEAISDGIASNLRAQLPASSHVTEFPTFRLMYALLPLSGGTMFHRAEATFTANIWHQRS